MSEIYDLDDYLENEKLFAGETKISDLEKKQNAGKSHYAKKAVKAIIPEDIYDVDGSQIVSKTDAKNKANERAEREKDTIIGTASNAISRHAKEKLESYIKRSPQYKVLEKQIELLEAELKEYSAIKNKELANKTRELIKSLKENKNKFVKIYQQKNYKIDKEEQTEKIKNSELLKKLKEERKELEAEFKEINPNSIVTKLKSYRDAINLRSKDDRLKTDDFQNYFDDFDNYSESNEILDFDDFVDDLPNNILDQEYKNFIGDVSEMIDVLPSELLKMNLSQVKNLLVENTSQERLDEITKRLNENKFEAANEMSRLKGTSDITNIMFEIFDFETVPEQQPKEMLAAANVEYVKSIAYSMATKRNLMHQFDDIMAYGFLGLSLALDKWYSIQKITNSPVSFQGFSHSYIANNIKKGIWDLNSKGTGTGNSLATLQTKIDEQFTNFLKGNPELKDLPRDVIESMIDGLEGSIKSAPTVITEGAYTDMVGGSDMEGGSDIWANVASDNVNDVEEQQETIRLFNAFKSLFDLFETKKDSTTGELYTTNKKLFNKYEYKLFKLIFGLEYKTELTGGKNTRCLFKQEEIREILLNYYKENNEMFLLKSGDLSQSAISTRIDELKKKIQKVLKTKPSLQEAFDYMWYNSAKLYNHIIENVNEIYSDIPNTLDNLENGKSVENVIENDDDLESEISEIYKN